MDTTTTTTDTETEALLGRLDEIWRGLDGQQVLSQARYVDDRGANLTETVARWADYLPDRIVMPHPSPRNRHWLTKNPWFEADTLPALRARVAQVLG